MAPLLSRKGRLALVVWVVVRGRVLGVGGARSAAGVGRVDRGEVIDECLGRVGALEGEVVLFRGLVGREGGLGVLPGCNCRDGRRGFQLVRGAQG